MNTSLPNDDDLSQRIERLEFLLTHVDTVVAQLNEVVVSQSKEIAMLQAKCQRLSQQLKLIQLEETAQPQDRRLEEERPPHY